MTVVGHGYHCADCGKSFDVKPDVNVGMPPSCHDCYTKRRLKWESFYKKPLPVGAVKALEREEDRKIFAEPSDTPLKVTPEQLSTDQTYKTVGGEIGRYCNATRNGHCCGLCYGHEGNHYGENGEDFSEDEADDLVAIPISKEQAAEFIHVGTTSAADELKKFIKADANKPRVELIPTEFILAMGEGMGHGAKTRPDGNWQKCTDPKRYEGSAMRHLLKHIGGEELDPDSGLSHLALAGCSLAMLYGLLEMKKND